MSKTDYYISSGKYSYWNLSLFIVISLIVSFIAALSYVALNWWLTNFVFSVLLVFGYVKFGALFFQTLINICKIRSQSMHFWLGLLIGVLFYYFQWIIWIESYLKGNIFIDDIDILVSPINLWNTILDIKKTYNIEFSVRGRTDEAGGLLLNIFWILEGFIIILGPSILTDLEKPFCEESNIWATATKIPIKFGYIESPNEVVNNLENKDYNCIKKLGIAKSGQSYSSFTMYFCEKEKESFLTIENVKITKNNEGKIEKDKNIVTSLIHVDYKLARQIVLSVNKLGVK